MELTLNGKTVKTSEGKSVLDVINDSKTYIPQLCKDPDMKPIGACRTCLVEIEGINGIVASCSVKAEPNMKIWTNTERPKKLRAGVIELTLGMLPKNKSKSFRELTTAKQMHQIKTPQFQSRERQPADTSNPVFNISMNDCILCGRCTQACQTGHQFIGAIDFLGTSTDSRIGTFMDSPLIDSVCTTCGQCLSVCPTGAISIKSEGNSTTKEVDTTCPYCGVGCGITAQVDSNQQITAMLDNPLNESSKGMLCVKGRFGFKYIHHKDRLKQPLIRKNGILTESSWEEAIEYVGDQLSIYRGTEFATLCSAKATNEDGYIQQKFARTVMTTNNIDHCTRLCHSPSVEAMLESLGSGATSNSYIDYEEAGCLVIVGSDANSNHPVAAARMRKAVVEKGAKLIIINPRRIEMCDFADLWLRPNPGTDVALLNTMAKVILDENLSNETFIKERTEGYEEWKNIIDQYTLSEGAKITGIPEADIAQAAKYYASPPFSGSCLIWGMGVTQHTNGTANAHSLLNLAFVSGQLGKPGNGISPLRGQNNVQGCGDAGCIPNSYPGYQPFTESNNEKFKDAWQAPNLPVVNGLVVTDMIEEAHKGTLKAMYITGENPLLSEPNLTEARKAFMNLKFLVVQDIFLHETAEIADVVLPATTFAEKTGTFTNSERRVQMVNKIIDPIGNTKPDWEIICEVAKNISKKLGLDLEKQFEYDNASEIWDEMSDLTPIMKGINYQRLKQEGGIQWPCPDTSHPGTRFLYADSFPRGERAKFVGFKQGPPAEEMPSKRFPLILNTGRILYHWHGGTITKRSEELLKRSPELEININPDDGSKYSINDGEVARIISKRGKLEGKIVFSDKMRSGEIFIPFVKLNKFAANFLTNSAYDPTSKIPEYKVCAVRIENVN